MKIVVRIVGFFLWVLAAGGAGFGAFSFLGTYIVTFSSEKQLSAPQEAALAASSVALAVLPYVLARAYSEIVEIFLSKRWD